MANTFYLDPTKTGGSNNGKTLTNAWLAFSDILWSGDDGTEINAGDTLYIVGTYTCSGASDYLTVGVTGTALLPVTIRGDLADSDAGVIDATLATYGIIVSGKDYIDIKNLTITDALSNGLRMTTVTHCNIIGVESSDCGAANCYCVTASDIIFTDCTFDDGTTTGLYLAIASDCTLTNVTATGNGTNGCHLDTVSDTTLTNCVFNTNTEYGCEIANLSDNIIITDCTMNSNVKHGIRAQGNVLITNVTINGGFYSSNGTGASHAYDGININMASGLTIDGATCSSNDRAGMRYGNTSTTKKLVYNVDCTVKNCICNANYTRGILIIGTNLIVDNNSCDGNGTGEGVVSDIKAGDGSGGTVQISNNTSKNFLGTGAGMNASATTDAGQVAKTIDFYNNVVTNCAAEAYHLGDDAAIDIINFYNNVADTCLRGIDMFNIGNYRIFNNTIYNASTVGIFIARGGDAEGTYVFKNNIVRGSGTYAIQWVDTEGGTLDSNNNILEDGDTAFALYDDGSGAVATTFAEWQALNLDLDSSQSDPLFTNDSYGNFNILFGSPAINIGVFDGAPTVDILGNSRSGDPDAGAYEYAGLELTVTETSICNLAFGKFGGAGDQDSGDDFISNINADTRLSKRCKLLFPRVRRKVILDLATLKAPFIETLKFYDTGSTESTLSPETGGWEYQFDLPLEVLAVHKQIPEEFRTTQTSITDRPMEFRFQTILSGATRLLLTNDLTNEDVDGAFIQYVYDQRNPAVFSEGLIECIVTLLASMLAPTVGPKGTTRQELLAEYKTVSIPEAMGHNQIHHSKFRVIPDLKGGRS